MSNNVSFYKIISLVLKQLDFHTLNAPETSEVSSMTHSEQIPQNPVFTDSCEEAN